LIDPLTVHRDLKKLTRSHANPDTVNILNIPLFTTKQVQCILWFSWTTTATPSQIAKIHNRAFSDSPSKMSRWNIVDIENSIATDWYERGCSFGGMNPTPLITPPGDNNPFSCLCDFGVPNCYDFKRDQESAENLEKLSMARMLWDAKPKEMVRCPHGRRRPKSQDSSLQTSEPQQTPIMPGRVFAILVLPVAIIVLLFKEEIFGLKAD
jgi:hypothetical protein